MVTASLAANVAAFLLALVVNITFASSLSDNSVTASAAAVAQGGLRPARWAFSIWGILYVIFGIGYAWCAFAGVSVAVPWVLCLAWLANAAWMLAGAKDAWTLAMGLILLYLCFSFIALPAFACEGSDGSVGPTILNGAAAAVCVWLTAAAFLNLQIIAPQQAYLFSYFAVPAVFVVSTVMLGRASGLSLSPAVFSACVLLTLVWIVIATLPAKPAVAPSETSQNILWGKAV